MLSVNILMFNYSPGKGSLILDRLIYLMAFTKGGRVNTVWSLIIVFHLHLTLQSNSNPFKSR